MRNVIAAFLFGFFCLCAMLMSGCEEKAHAPQVYQSGQGQYILIYSYSVDDLTTGVNWKLAEGYVPEGPIVIEAVRYRPTVYFQKMITAKDPNK